MKIDDFSIYCKDRWGKNWEDFQPFLETQKEEELIQLLWKMGIQSSVKTDKKSLPYQHVVTQNEVIGNLTQTSHLYRKFIQHLLEEDTYKIRFFIETKLDYSHILDIPNPFSYVKGITYELKYYIHKK